MKQKIKVEERHIADLWRLPCVNGLAKTQDGGMLVAIGSQAVEQLAYDGDWLIETAIKSKGYPMLDVAGDLPF